MNLHLVIDSDQEAESHLRMGGDRDQNRSGREVQAQDDTLEGGEMILLTAGIYSETSAERSSQR